MIDTRTRDEGPMVAARWWEEQRRTELPVWHEDTDQDFYEQLAAMTSWAKQAAGVSRQSAQSELECQFRPLADAWRDATSVLSDQTDKAVHPAYQRIIGLGRGVLPLVLLELKRRPAYWFWALEALTGENPAADATTFREARDAWLQWGAERGYL